MGSRKHSFNRGGRVKTEQYIVLGEEGGTLFTYGFFDTEKKKTKFYQDF